jgi:RimJ/RimL family protein N-acetyltransferase
MGVGLMNEKLLNGELVCLVAPDPESVAKNFARWAQDSEYARLLDSDPARMWSVKKIQEWIEKEMDKEIPTELFFMIHTLEDGHTIGFVGLDGISWTNGDAWMGIGIGERECWDKGYGTDAMRIILRYALTELNLHRVSLCVFEYNPRAIRSYQKAGFVHEGRSREQLNREGKRWDMIFMGILRQEWEKTIVEC